MSQFIVDTSAFVSLGVGDYLKEVVSRLECHTTETVQDELLETTKHQDEFARAAESVLEEIESNTVSIKEVNFDSSAFHNRIHRGEASCIVLGNQMDAQYLLADDHKARHRIEDCFNHELIHSPYIIGALYRKEIISRREALTQFLKMTEKRNWMDSALLTYGADIIFEDTEINVQEILKIFTNLSQENVSEKMESISQSILEKVGLREE